MARLDATRIQAWRGMQALSGQIRSRVTPAQGALGLRP